MITKHQIGDYLTTVALAAIPIVVANQDAIGKMVPVEYVLGFTIIMGILSQLATNLRVKKAQAEVANDVDLINEAIDAKQAKLVELQGELDKYQALASKVVAPEEPAVEQPATDYTPDPEDPHSEPMN